MDAQPVDFPASVVVGQRDRFYEDGKRLAGLYVAPQFHEHPGGHDFPAAKEATHAEWVRALRTRLELDGTPGA
eukprot:4094481-Prymnesium_polylepis.1